jgi:hypothetical protein
LSNLFENDDGDTTIADATSTSPLVFYTDPQNSDLYNAYNDTIVLLKDRYTITNGWVNFNQLDFTSMYATQVEATAGTIGNKGTITISAVPGSTIYKDSVQVT